MALSVLHILSSGEYSIYALLYLTDIEYLMRVIKFCPQEPSSYR